MCFTVYFLTYISIFQEVSGGLKKNQNCSKNISIHNCFHQLILLLRQNNQIDGLTDRNVADAGADIILNVVMLHDG